ncbi:MFS transporter [Bifidobacterium simiarum]|uniref:MFS transporter n=1 Tax=Bifidobacterium simiarum TaxID=2045441 RepID=UPI001BDCE326|nr:MFS transporter [Bifidobacterium simiarum]MBT1166426.1 MFS transporter [Bifidobacterium simiarum]
MSTTTSAKPSGSVTVQTPAALSFRQPLTIKDYIGYGIGDTAINFTFASLNLYVVYFYTDVIGVAAGIIGTIMLFSRSFDGVIDMVVGSLIDKTHTKWGKARPWLLFGCVPFALFTVLLFTVPAGWSETWKVGYIFISYNLLMIAFSSMAIPYGTLNSMVTQDRAQREGLNLWRMLLAQVGVLIVTNCTYPMVELFGGTQMAWAITYAILSCISVVLFLVVFKTQKERVHTADVEEQVPLKESFHALLQNKYWFLAFFYFILLTIAQTLYQGGLVYYAKYVLNNEGIVGVLTFAYLIPTMAFLPFCPKLFGRFGKTICLLIGSAVYAVGFILPVLNPTNLELFVVAQVLRGLGQGPIAGAVWALFPDTIEYGYYKTGVRNEGLLYSGGSLGQKIGSGLGTALVGWILAFGGYDGLAATQSASAINAIYQISLWGPAILLVVCVVIMCFYDIDKKYDEIMAGVAKRQAEAERRQGVSA